MNSHFLIILEIAQIHLELAIREKNNQTVRIERWTNKREPQNHVIY